MSKYILNSKPEITLLMNKYLITVLALIGLLFFACSKSGNSQNGPKNTGATQIKIQLVSGGGQTDTAGNPLSNPVIVEVTKNGLPVAGYSVIFQGPGCGQSDQVSTTSPQNGLIGLNWSLTGDVGQQSIKIWVLDASNNKADSVTVTETALASGPGWHNGGCSLQSNAFIAGFCKLSTGRMFVCYDSQTYLRYSDDNGANWYAVTSLGKTHQVMKVVSTPSNEVLAFTAGTDGTFYSNDGGQTWTNLGVPPFNPEHLNGVVYTPDGKLLATSTDVPLSISLDKGKTWTAVSASNFTPPNSSPAIVKNPCEDKEGNFYVVVEAGNAIYMSSDEGKTWSPYQANNGIIENRQQAFYIDNNNTFYIATWTLNMGIAASANGTATYKELVATPPSDAIDNMSLQSDGRFYYEDISSGLYAVNSGSSSGQRIFPFPQQNLLPYILAKNNNIIIANTTTPYIRCFTK